MSTRPHALHVSPPRPCPYLPGREESVVATELAGAGARRLYARGIRAGFRRSHNFMYRPACSGCDACRPVRVVIDDFESSRSLERVRRVNRQVTAESGIAAATTEQFGVFQRYQADRHPGGGMDLMSFLEYRAMIEDSPIETFATEFRVAGGTLSALMLADVVADGLSAVYSFYDPARPKLALGTYMILWLIDETARRGLPYLYLGYWIEGCAKMDYKARFRPLEAFGPEGWSAVDVERGTGLREAV